MTDFDQVLDHFAWSYVKLHCSEKIEKLKTSVLETV